MRHGKYRRLLRLINRILGKIYAIISFSEKLFFIKSGFIVWTGEDFQRRERNSIQLGLLRFRVGFVFWYVSFSGTFRFRVRSVFEYVLFSGTFRFWVRFVLGCAPFLVTFCFIFGYVSVTFRLRVRFVMFRLRLRFVFGYVSFSGTFRFRLRFVFRYVSFSVTFLLCVFFCYALFSGTKTLLWTLNV